MSDFIDETYKRVVQLISFKELRISSFEHRINVSNNSIGTAIRRKASFKSNVLNKILNCFPDINPTWLLTGKGSMLLDEQGFGVAKESGLNYQVSDLKTEIKSNLISLLTTDEEVKLVLEEQLQNVIKK